MFCQNFCFTACLCSPESCLKNSLVLRSAFLRKFSWANFWYLAYVLCQCFLVLFCLVCCSILCLLLGFSDIEKLILAWVVEGISWDIGGVPQQSHVPFVRERDLKREVGKPCGKWEKTTMESLVFFSGLCCSCAYLVTMSLAYLTRFCIFSLGPQHPNCFQFCPPCTHGNVWCATYWHSNQKKHTPTHSLSHTHSHSHTDWYMLQ